MKVSKNSGVSIVEIIIGAAIILTVVIGASAAWQSYIKLSTLGTNVTAAVLLTEEANEAIQYFRDLSWSGNISPLALGTTYYLSYSNNQYQLVTTPISNQNLTRTIVFSEVKRDPVTKIITSAGSTDPDTISALITVFPTSNQSDTIIKTETLIHNIYAN